MRHPPRRLSESASWSRNIGLLKNHGLFAFSEVACERYGRHLSGLFPNHGLWKQSGGGRPWQTIFELFCSTATVLNSRFQRLRTELRRMGTL